MTCTPCEMIDSVRDYYRDVPTPSLPEWIFYPEGELQFQLAFSILAEREAPEVQAICDDGCLDAWTHPDLAQSVVRKMASWRVN